MNGLLLPSGNSRKADDLCHNDLKLSQSLICGQQFARDTESIFILECDGERKQEKQKSIAVTDDGC